MLFDHMAERTGLNEHFDAFSKWPLATTLSTPRASQRETLSCPDRGTSVAAASGTSLPADEHLEIGVAHRVVSLSIPALLLLPANRFALVYTGFCKMGLGEGQYSGVSSWVVSRVRSTLGRRLYSEALQCVGVYKLPEYLCPHALITSNPKKRVGQREAEKTVAICCDGLPGS
jgi:hypothetical protein